MHTRRDFEVAFQLAAKGQQLADWLFQQRSQGQSLRSIAQSLTQRTGMPVSHESIRKWMQEG